MNIPLILFFPAIGLCHWLSERTGIGSIQILPFVLIGLWPWWTTRINGYLILCGLNIACTFTSVLVDDLSIAMRIYPVVYLSGSILAGLAYARHKQGMKLALCSIGLYAVMLVVPLCMHGQFTPGGHYHSMVEEGGEAGAFQFSHLDAALLVGVLTTSALGSMMWYIRRRIIGWSLLFWQIVCGLGAIELVFLNRRSVLGAIAATTCLLFFGRYGILMAIPAMFAPFYWEQAAGLLAVCRPGPSLPHWQSPISMGFRITVRCSTGSERPTQVVRVGMTRNF